MSITQRGKDTWRITVYTGKIDGQYQRVTETFKGLKSDAKARESELKKQVKHGGLIADKKITFKEFTDKWHEEYAENLAPKTCSEHKRMLEVVNSYIGNIRLIDISTMTLTVFYNKLRERGKETKGNDFIPLAEKTILNYYSLINGVLNKAVQWDYLERNPNLKVEKPKVNRKPSKYYDKEQALRLIECLENEPLKYQALIFLAIDTGARRGELTGLDWDDIDFKNGYVRIDETTQYINGKIIVKAPKNNSSIRVVPITSKTVNVLKEYKREQLEREILLGDKWEKTTKVFTSNFGGMMFPNTPSDIFTKICKKYKLDKLNFHGLRHTSVSLLINAGIPLQVISKRVGHSTTATTSNIYSHVFESSELSAKNELENIFSDKNKEVFEKITPN